MSSRHQPLNGADSADAWNPRPYIILMEDDDAEGDRITVRVKAAIGPRDAESQARDMHPYYVPLRAEVDEAELDYADAEMERAKAEPAVSA